MVTKTKEILDTLSKMDLSKYPYDEIHELIRQTGRQAVILTTLHPGERIIRARVNDTPDSYYKKEHISYKPAEYNKTYQRASTPNTTMFYGAIIPENIKPTELDSGRAIGYCEVSKLLRDKSITEGEQTITYANWVVTKEINLVSIVHNSDYFDGNSTLKQLHDDYTHFIYSHPPEVVENSLLVSNFFAGQFAKAEIQHDYDYMLSAVYAERITWANQENIQIAGVLYPSVRAEGKGFNIAITPEYANNCLSLEAVLECSLYKKNKQVICDNDKQVFNLKNQMVFELQPIVNPKIHIGREMAYKILNGEVKI